HEASMDLSRDIEYLVRSYQIPLLFLGIDPVTSLQLDQFSSTNGSKGMWMKEMLQRLRIPILLCPKDQRFARIPFFSLLVPMSGEARNNAALEQAINIADHQRVPIDLIHVSTGQDSESSQCPS